MTKKHFIALAASIKEIEDIDARQKAANAVISVGKMFNSNFSAIRFCAACGL